MRMWDNTKLLWRILFLLLVINTNTTHSVDLTDPNSWYINAYNGTVYDYYCLRINLGQYPRYCGLYNAAERAAILVFCSLSHHIQNIFYGAGLALGVPGNTFNLIVVFKMPLKPSTIYFGLLAGADLIAVLVVGLLEFVIKKLCFSTFIGSTKLIFRITGSVSTTLSVWMLFLVSLERYTSVQWPKSKIYTIRSTVISIVAVAIICAASGAVGGAETDVDIGLFQYIWYLTYVNDTLALYIPTGCIILFSTLTAMKLKKVIRRRNNSTESHSSKREDELTKLIIVASFCTSFLLLFPIGNAIFSTYVGFTYAQWCPLSETFFTFYELLSPGLYMFQNAIKFYVFIAVSPIFRNLFLAAFVGKRSKKLMTMKTSKTSEVEKDLA